MLSMQWFVDFLDRARAFVPTAIAAIGLVLGGGILAFVLSRVTRRLVAGVVDRTQRFGLLETAVRGTGIRAAVPRIVSGFVFWGVWLLFVAGAIETLGLTQVTSVLNEVARYLPNVLAGVVVLGAGIVTGRLVRRAVGAAARSAGLGRSEGVGQLAQTAIVLVAVVISLEQVGIDAQLLVMLLTVTIGTTFASVALAFGIGARTAVSNIIGSHYVQQAYQVGQTVRIGELEGEILQTTPTAVILATAEGRVLVPARRFSEDPSTLLVPGA